jgi:hypothetical protein
MHKHEPARLRGFNLGLIEVSSPINARLRQRRQRQASDGESTESASEVSATHGESVRLLKETNRDKAHRPAQANRRAGLLVRRRYRHEATSGFGERRRITRTFPILPANSLNTFNAEVT